jgi:hypothetical protein
MVESLVSLGIDNIKDYDSSFSDIVVAFNTYGGKTFPQNSYIMGELQTKYENIFCNIFASFTYDIRYVL